MLSFKDYQRINATTPTTVGQQIKEQSDMVMQETWWNDIQTRTCYLYDYYHDDNPDVRNGYIPNTNNGKIKVDLKFIITAYKSIAKDDPEYHIQFSPGDWNGGNLIPEWFKQYSDVDVHFPIGMYVDIPDDRGIYWKWQIVYEDVSNQFPKFGVIKCNYLFRWITDNGVNRYKRKMWGTQRTQSSLKRLISQRCVMIGNKHNELLSNCWKAFRALLLQRKYEIRLSVNV